MEVRKKQLSPRRMAAVKEAVYSLFPIEQGQEEEEVWKTYRIAIDSSCRGLVRRSRWNKLY